MRAGIVVVVALAAAATGCQGFARTFGLQEKTAKDMSDKNTKAGDPVVDEGTTKVKVANFVMDFKSSPATVQVDLVNEGAPQEFIAFEVEFGYPAPPEAIAPYVPEFVEVVFTDWKAGETQSKTVTSTSGSQDAPRFARVVPVSGTDVRRTTGREASVNGLKKGTSYFGGTVEVVKVEGNLSPVEGTKANLAFTLESMSDTDVGNLRYMVQFFGSDGKPIDLGRAFRRFQAVGKPLGKSGDTVVVEVALDPVPGLAKAQPVLRLIK